MRKLVSKALVRLFRWALARGLIYEGYSGRRYVFSPAEVRSTSLRVKENVRYEHPKPQFGLRRTLLGNIEAVRYTYEENP